MTYTAQHVQMARHVVQALSIEDGRSLKLLARVAQRTGLPPRKCAAEIRAIAALPHPLDAAAGAMWTEAFKAA